MSFKCLIKLFDFFLFDFLFRLYPTFVLVLLVFIGTSIDGSTIEVVLAKPVDRDSYHYTKAAKAAVQVNSRCVGQPVNTRRLL